MTSDGPKPKKLTLASVRIAQPIAIDPYKKKTEVKYLELYVKILF